MTWAEAAVLIEALASPWTMLAGLTAFGFAPAFVVRIAVLVYPAGHSRRGELVAELYRLGRLKRPFFAAEVVATALVEGVGERYCTRPPGWCLTRCASSVDECVGRGTSWPWSGSPPLSRVLRQALTSCSATSRLMT